MDMYCIGGESVGIVSVGEEELEDCVGVDA
jgi:hypothetical protein